MTLDEAITHAREEAKEQRSHIGHWNEEYSKKCEVWAEEYEQLAEWLEELKFLRQWKSDVMDSFCRYDVSSFEELVTNARNKAIDDFATKICEVLEEYQTGFNMVSMANIWHFSRELAEQLKAGISND